MLIATTSSSSAPVLLNPALTLRPKIPEIGLLSPTTSGSSSALTPSPASSSKTSTSSSTPKSGDARPHGGGGGAAATAASEVATLVGTYSTTVAGTQYAGSVEEQNGSYVASVPNVSGATATGASMIEAENNLTVRIDELV